MKKLIETMVALVVAIVLMGALIGGFLVRRAVSLSRK